MDPTEIYVDVSAQAYNIATSQEPFSLSVSAAPVDDISVSAESFAISVS